MLSAKGQDKHRMFGKLFFSGMTGVFITAIPLSIIIKNSFLFLIAIFSYYLAFSGWRYSQNRSGLPRRLDWAISIFMLIISITMLIIGVGNPHQYKGIVLLVFGLLGLTFSFDDVKTYYYHSAVGKQRISKHLGAMLGATIAAITAFVVTNIHIKSTLFLWLGPTIGITPIIFWWKYKVMSLKVLQRPKKDKVTQL